MSSYNVLVENASSDNIHQLVTLTKKNPKVFFDTINDLVCPAAPVTLTAMLFWDFSHTKLRY